MPKSSNPAPKRRLVSNEAPHVGSTRYQLIGAAAKQVRRALDEGFCLEAVTLLESLIAERLEKRAQWLSQINADPSLRKMFEKVNDGFVNLGDLIPVLRKAETDEHLRSDVLAADAWRKRRNVAIHEMAKFGTGGQAAATWVQRQTECRAIADEGVTILLALDVHERAASHAGRNKLHASATCPDGLASLGQPFCEWCEHESEGRSSRPSRKRANER